MNKNNHTTDNKKVNVDEVCLLCGKTKQADKDVCGVCMEDWENARESSLVDNLLDIPFDQWLLDSLQAVLPAITKELEATQKKLEDFKTAIQDQAHREITNALVNWNDPKFDEFVKGRRQKLWNDGGGGKLFGKVKYLELRVNTIPGLVEEIQERIATNTEASLTAEAQKSKSQKPEVAVEAA